MIAILCIFGLFVYLVNGLFCLYAARRYDRWYTSSWLKVIAVLTLWPVYVGLFVVFFLFETLVQKLDEI